MLLNPSKLVKAFGFPLVCLAMFSVAGAHWAALQTVAWAQMLWNYSAAAGSLVTGADKTFSGEYPCEMCREIEAGKKEERRAAATVQMEKKAEKIIVAFPKLVSLPPISDFQFPLTPEPLRTRSVAPPDPVPILAA